LNDSKNGREKVEIMPKYNVETTVIYRFQVEADSRLDAESMGFAFEEQQRVLDVEDVVVEEIKEN
jgi:hypothetical protein